MQPPNLPPVCDLNLVVKRHTHDVRNVLNGIEIELTLLDESHAGDPVLKQAFIRMRQTVTELNKLVRGLAAKFGTDTPKEVAALQIAERWRNDSRLMNEEGYLDWDIHLGNETVWLDPSLIRSLLSEGLEMLVRSNPGRPTRVRCWTSAGMVVYQVEPLQWGTDHVRRLLGQQPYWSALRSIGESAGIAMLPEKLESLSVEPLRFELACHGSVS